MRVPRKLKIILAIVAVLALVGAWQYVTFLFHYGYSRGSRTGVIRKVSVKGPPYCKYLEGELALQGSSSVVTDLFKFSVDDDHDSNPTVQALREAERTGSRVTVDYRQDITPKIWWRCNPNEYFITKLEK